MYLMILLNISIQWHLKIKKTEHNVLISEWSKNVGHISTTGLSSSTEQRTVLDYDYSAKGRKILVRW